MNVERIKRNVRQEFGDVRFSGSHEADGVLRLVVERGQMVTESMIEADYHSEHFEADERFVAVVDPETAEVLGRDEVE